MKDKENVLNFTHQLCTISFCTARRASYLTLGSSCPRSCITRCFPPSCSIMLKYIEWRFKLQF